MNFIIDFEYTLIFQALHQVFTNFSQLCEFPSKILKILKNREKSFFTRLGLCTPPIDHIYAFEEVPLF